MLHAMRTGGASNAAEQALQQKFFCEGYFAGTGGIFAVTHDPSFQYRDKQNVPAKYNNGSSMPF